MFVSFIGGQIYLQNLLLKKLLITLHLLVITSIKCGLVIVLFSSAVPPGSGAFQMPTRPSAAAAVSASTLRGGRPNLRNASVTFLFFGMKLLWDDIDNIS